MESWEDLVKKSAAEKAAKARENQSWLQIEAYQAQLEYWKTNLKSKVDLRMMNYILEDVNRAFNLRGNIRLLDEESIKEGPWEGGFQGTRGYRNIYTKVKYGPSLSIPSAGSIGIFASPKFDWKLMAMQYGSGKTQSIYNVEGSYASGDVSLNPPIFGAEFQSGKAKKLVADNIAEMKSRRLI